METQTQTDRPRLTFFAVSLLQRVAALTDAVVVLEDAVEVAGRALQVQTQRVAGLRADQAAAAREFDIESPDKVSIAGHFRVHASLQGDQSGSLAAKELVHSRDAAAGTLSRETYLYKRLHKRV